MFRRILFAVLVFGASLPLVAQAHTQSAREALIEMFSGTTVQSFERHLLKETVVRIHQMTDQQQQQLQASRAMMKSNAGQNGLTWYGDGPVLVSYTDPGTSTKFDVLMEKDEPGDGVEDMELSFRSTGPEQKKFSSFVPRVLITMRQEDEVWKLAEFGFSLKVKLDAALLDSFAEKMSKAAAVPVTPAAEAPREISVQMLGKQEKAAADAVRMLVAAEQAYKIAFPSKGYTCALSALGGQGDGIASDERAGLTDSRLESGTLEGYRVSLLGCRGEPITGYKIMAVPEGASRYGKRAFCAEENGQVRFSEDGRGITCLSEKNVLK